MRKPPRRNSVAYFMMCVKADARRYHGKWFKEPGFWATFGYRLRCLRKFGPAGCVLLLPFDIILGIYRRVVAHCEMPAGTRIGPGLFLPHPEGVILSDKCRIGSEVIVFQQVTAGCWKNQSPRIRSRSAIFAGAKVIGGVTVGRGAGVGANAVVTKDVPPRHVAVGIPAVARPMRDENMQSLQINLGMPDEADGIDSMVFPGRWERKRMAQ